MTFYQQASKRVDILWPSTPLRLVLVALIYDLAQLDTGSLSTPRIIYEQFSCHEHREDDVTSKFRTK